MLKKVYKFIARPQNRYVNEILFKAIREFFHKNSDNVEKLKITEIASIFRLKPKKVN